jgi:hypothetical protein
MMGREDMGGASESVFFVKPENDKGQYKILPIMMSLLIDQDHVQDLLVELENSPMSIQVMDFELQRPSSRVTKPEKGAIANLSGYGESMMSGMMGGRGGMGMMSGYGGMMSGYAGMMSRMMGGGRGRMAGMMKGRMGSGMGMGASAPSRQGSDKRGQDRGKTRKEEKEAVESAKGPSLFDPYFDIVEVKVYGQARFYNPPPADTQSAPSLGETAADADAASTPAAAAGETPNAEASGAEPAEADQSKSVATKVEPAKAEPAKATEPAAQRPKEPAKEAEMKPGSPKS